MHVFPLDSSFTTLHEDIKALNTEDLPWMSMKCSKCSGHEQLFPQSWLAPVSPANRRLFTPPASFQRGGQILSHSNRDTTAVFVSVSWTMAGLNLEYTLIRITIDSLQSFFCKYIWQHMQNLKFDRFFTFSAKLDQYLRGKQSHPGWVETLLPVKVLSQQLITCNCYRYVVWCLRCCHFKIKRSLKCHSGRRGIYMMLWGNIRPFFFF